MTWPSTTTRPPASSFSNTPRRAAPSRPETPTATATSRCCQSPTARSRTGGTTSTRWQSSTRSAGPPRQQATTELPRLCQARRPWRPPRWRRPGPWNGEMRRAGWLPDDVASVDEEVDAGHEGRGAAEQEDDGTYHVL